MERERNRYVEETADLTQKLLCRFEDLKVREMQIFEYKKKIAEVESNLKVQQNIQEKVEEERNDYVKEVIEMQVTVSKIALVAPRFQQSTSAQCACCDIVGHDHEAEADNKELLAPDR